MADYGPKVTLDQLIAGVRVHYTGDMANNPAAGAIVKRWTDEKFGYHHIRIAFENDRFEGDWRETVVSLADFQPGPGRRFWLESDWLERRDRQIREFQEHYALLKA